MANTPRFGRESQRTRMVVGFAFNPAKSRVALIKKKRGPEFSGMVDTLNGIGGHAQPGETYTQAMTREFYQEAGVAVAHWKHFATLDSDSYRVYVFSAQLEDRVWRRLFSKTDEQVTRVSVRRLPESVYADVRWLIPLALDPWTSAVVRIDRRAI